jgi:hypothetical protein
MEAPEWREESDGTFIAETARVSLVVCRLADRRHARFLVMARPSNANFKFEPPPGAERLQLGASK